MEFYIQKEEELVLNISVQTDDDQNFALVPETPHLATSSCTHILLHVPNFQHTIHGNTMAARDQGVYLVSLEANNDLTIHRVGG
ncbi:hypothetical protein FK220_011555 [Flavobacteriaceae bacterium TP-CH-4]|uniref:Uncharacterized protein n=1 Tax=Pelagihabitans pacificus TaxID=2696054 RepID=A0A967B0Q1_9FLAO|nr:hypothetical protein [Pelagihabitans pacificus]NHF59981.1 hypothetical protein [Pelagihabitans pacificus]